MGNGSVTYYGYDTLLRTTDVWHQTSGGTTLGRYQYTYDGASNVASRTDNDGSVTSFGYDNANQLTSEARSTPNAYTATYTYDSNGNRASKTIGGVETDYTYDSHDHLTAAGGKSYTYDANGNCTSVTQNNQTTTLAYTYDNRISQITYPNSSTNTFQYNGLGLRTQKVDSTGTRNYVCDGASVASTVLSDGNAVYSDGSERRSGASSFRHTDALGSTRGITSSSQSATDSLLLDAFGMTVGRTGTTPTPFGFVGSEQYQTDPDSGLMLLGHRYYDPSIGRFITSDPVQDGDNWYAYCENDPLGAVDPEGTDPKDPPVPPTPPGVDLNRNVRDCWIHEGDAYWFYLKVKTGGPWDFKDDPRYRKWPRVEEFGNYQFGYMGHATGIPLPVLLNEAGKNQEQNWKKGTWPGRSGPHLWPWAGVPPYGDDRRDQDWIKRGYQDYHKDYETPGGRFYREWEGWIRARAPHPTPITQPVPFDPFMLRV